MNSGMPLQLNYSMIAQLILPWKRNSASSEVYAQLGGLKLGGFNPATGYSWIQCTFDDKNLFDHRLQMAAIALSGPIFGIAGSLLTFKLLETYQSTLYLTQIIAVIGLLNHTVGFAGLGGFAISDKTDLPMATKLIKEYLNS